MYCGRRLYKGNSYEICLPLTDTGITTVSFYTSGDVIIEKEPETTADTMCFLLTKEDLDALQDGVLRYSYEDHDSNTSFVIVTPGDYSGSTLDDLLDEAYESGYTQGLEECSGGSCEGVWEEGYDTGFVDGVASVDCSPYFESGYTSGHTDGYSEGYTEGEASVDCTPFYESGYTSGSTDGFNTGYDSGYTDGSSSCVDEDLVANLQGDYFVIPEGTNKIRDYAFYEACISSLTIPNSVEEIGEFAFGYDDCLEHVTIPSSITKMGRGAFAGCESLIDATFEGALDKIEPLTFSLCNSLTSVTFPSGVTEIGYQAFMNCLSLSSITIPDSVTEIKENAFNNSSGLTEITLPTGLTKISNRCFYNCLSLTSITIPSGVTLIDSGAFQSCSAIQEITIPSGVTVISPTAFQYCGSLSSVTLPDSLQILGIQAFRGDGRLTGITIPSGVTEIGSSCFMDCSGLTEMTFLGTVPPTLLSNRGSNASLGSTAYTFPIYVPCSSLQDYKTAFGQYYEPRITCIQPTPVYSAMPLTFDIISGGTIGWDNSQNNVNIEYSADNGQTWQNFTSLNVNAGDKVMFRGTGKTDQSSFTTSSGTLFNAYGNLHSLLNSNFTGITNLESYNGETFYKLFSGNTGLVSAENLKLPATTLVIGCYRDMFYDCVNLLTGPELPAETLVSVCYFDMFYGCSKLNYVKCMAVNKEPSMTSLWLYGVSPAGTFVKHPNATWDNSGGGVPAGWTIVDAS